MINRDPQTNVVILNGIPVPLRGRSPTESLLRWLKQQRLNGTKEGCADGDCGACTVALVEVGADGSAHYRAVNSCLLPIGSLPGREVVTVEALANGETLHPVQQAMVDCAGSQCGYCTPGFVMSLFVAQQNHGSGEDAIEGNLCRCTGYQPIRAAAAQLAAYPPAADRFSAALRSAREPPAAVAMGNYFSPVTLEQALALKQQHSGAEWIAGATDLGVEFSRERATAPAYIALDRIESLQQLVLGEDAVQIGAGVCLSRIESELAGIFPALDQMLPWFAARQVRNRATLGGNLGTASPIGDLLPVLLALDASVQLRGTLSAHSVAIDAFFLDYRKTARDPDELIESVTVPRRRGLINASYKVAKRQTDDISIVAAAFALSRDGDGRLRDVRLAYGGVAAVPRRAKAVESFLEGRHLDAETLARTQQLLRDEFTPLSDHRGSAGYRRELCASLFAKFAAEHLA